MSKITKNKLAMLALAGLSTVASGSVFAGGMTVDSKGGVEVFDLDDTNYWFRVSGRLLIDQVWYDNDEDKDFGNNVAFPSGSHIRNGRVAMRGGVGTNWVYKF